MSYLIDVPVVGAVRLLAVNAISNRTLSVDIIGAYKRCWSLIFYDPVSSLRTVLAMISHFMPF